MKKLATKLFAVAAAMILILSSCSGNNASNEPKENIDGYKYGNYLKYATSDLDEDVKIQDKIYIKGKVEAVFKNNQYTHLIVVDDDNGNWLRWLLRIDVTADLEKVQKEFNKEEITGFGTYWGFSKAYNMPFMDAEKIICKNKEYNDLAIINEFVPSMDNSDNKEKSTEQSSTEKATEKPTEKPTEKATEKPKPTKKAPEKSADSPADNVPLEFSNALRQAQSYNGSLHLSKQGLYDQLTSEYGGKFPSDAANYAIENLNANWNENALKSAESYNRTLHLSKKGLYQQLTSEHGAKFTESEAQYAIDNLNADYKSNAVKSAQSYIDSLGLSKEQLYNQLTSEHGAQFTAEEAQYAIDCLYN